MLKVTPVTGDLWFWLVGLILSGRGLVQLPLEVDRPGKSTSRQTLAWICIAAGLALMVLTALVAFPH